MVFVVICLLEVVVLVFLGAGSSSKNTAQESSDKERQMQVKIRRVRIGSVQTSRILDAFCLKRAVFLENG